MDDVDSPEPTRAPRGGARRVERSGLPRWFRPVILYVLFAIAAYQMSGWLFHNLKGFLGLLFLAWLFSITVEPVVDRMERFGMRRGAAAGLVLFGLVLLVVGFLSLFGALLAEQLSQLVTALPDALSSVTQWANRTFDTNFSVDSDDLRITPDTVRELAARFTPGVLGVVTSLFEVVFQLLTMLLFAFYMSAEGPALRRTVASWFPAQQQRVISTVWEISVDKAGGYVVSRLILAAFSTVATVVHDAGGVVSAAHLKDHGTANVIEHLKNEGLDAVETRHPSHDPEVRARLTDLVLRFGLQRTGGSDWHGDPEPGTTHGGLGCQQVPREWLDRLEEFR